jgi:pimeloyl-ACP methyl ester carboxylesterase
MTVASAPALLMGAVLLAACGGGSNEAAPPTSTPSATSSTSPTADEGAVTVRVGPRELSGHCVGTRPAGAPAVLLAHGNGADEHQLSAVLEHLRTRTTVCSYTRAGAASAIGKHPVSQDLSDLSAFLAGAKVAPPYFLVGTSYGGGLVDLWVHAHPTEVAGFVIINPAPPPYTTWIAAARKVETADELTTLELPDYRGENPERIVSVHNDAQLAPLPASIPYVLLFDEDCGGDSDFCGRILKPLSALERRVAAAGKGGRFQAVPGAGHQIEDTRPDVVEQAVDETWTRATS